MGRTPKTLSLSAEDNLDPQRLAAAVQASQELVQLQTSYDDGRDLVNQLWGQYQMADAIAKLTTVVSLTKLHEIKENKLYRALAGKTALDRYGEKIADVGSWDGFCRAVGTSKSKVDEDLLNLKEFGEEAMENLSRIGAGYRELRQYRKLSDDQKTALIEVAKTGDKENFVELAEEIFSKHAKEKETLTQQLQSRDEIVVSKQRLIDHQADQLDELSAKARFIATCTPSEKLEGIRSELLQYATAIELQLASQLAPAFAKLKEHLGEHGGECDAYLSGALGQIERQVREIRENFGLLRAEDVAVWADAD